ncbi:hypothetical protein Nans01_00950 [Nocardiopsis ansamitocini]|uniref:Uncharacterized protein n=1 Tax=Nocardiopsis ansamitocini TaxID=1670832 RepID=A0A9W6P257_9ACTN|nr:hypothetical protein Nans01_00950 [Nocardiopsis ansamitocini]
MRRARWLPAAGPTGLVAQTLLQSFARGVARPILGTDPHVTGDLERDQPADQKGAQRLRVQFRSSDRAHHRAHLRVGDAQQP